MLAGDELETAAIDMPARGDPRRAEEIETARYRANAIRTVFRIVRQRRRRANHARQLARNAGVYVAGTGARERKSISVPTSIVWPWWRTRWCAASCPLLESRASYSNITRAVHPPPPASIHKIPRDVSDAILAGLARNPADRPASAHRVYTAVP